MSSATPDTTAVKRIANTEFTTSISGHTYKRRVGTTEWTEVVDSAPPPPPSPPPNAAAASDTVLMLVRYTQPPGEPYHWALYLGPDVENASSLEVQGQGAKATGTKFQVTGDAISMHYEHVTGV